MYVVDRDFGFAPNPFHGMCTLATCKPPIRKGARVGDWIVGMGGARLKATGRCVYAMRVSETLTFNTYWADPRFLDKRPVRNGSRAMMLGDNIYHRDAASGEWHQLDSHHSQADGSPNPLNIAKDTGADRVLVSSDFYYFGSAAPVVPEHILSALGYRNRRAHRVFDLAECAELISWIRCFRVAANKVFSNPFDFHASAMRYSGRGSALA